MVKLTPAIRNAPIRKRTWRRVSDGFHAEVAENCKRKLIIFYHCPFMLIKPTERNTQKQSVINICSIFFLLSFFKRIFQIDTAIKFDCTGLNF